MKTTVHTTIYLTSLIIVSAVFAQNKQVRRGRIDPAKRYARTGGIIIRQNNGPKIVFFNLQSAVASETIQRTASNIAGAFNFPCKVTSGASVANPLSALQNAKLNPNAAAVIGIGSSETLPSLLVAPETGWAFVNINKLKMGATQDLLKERLNKEIWRAFAYVMGAAHTAEPYACLMKPVLKPADLDALKLNAISPIPAEKIAIMAKKLGIRPRVTSTYAKAVQEGWAPAPKDDVQRELWKKYNKTPPKSK